MSALLSDSRLADLDYVVNTETGEVVEVVVSDPGFVIDSDAKADWVLGKMMGLDIQLLALDAELRAVTENIESKKRDVIRMRQSLDWRFGPELTNYAKSQLDGKTKTWKCVHGSVAFRKKAAKVVVTDEAEAVRTLEKMGAIDAIKKSIWLSKLPEGIADREGFAIEPESETVMVKTGAGVEK